jgi:predicted nucleotidyltransferase
MKIDPTEPICGVRPAVLKGLLERGEDGFTTPTAMQSLDLDEPEVTVTLSKLQKGGWIEYLGAHDGVDAWRSGPNGLRLQATTLRKKRIPHVRGQEILSDLINEVRAVNSEAVGSRRVTRIVLFGSLLTGASDDTVGDIDVVVIVRRRQIPTERLRELEAQERATAPESFRRKRFDLLGWPEIQLRRRLAKVSPYLSFHQEQDLAGSTQQEVYAYDLQRENEAPPDKSLFVQAEAPDDGLTAVPNPPYSRTPRTWPTAPTGASVMQLDGDSARLAQHLWMNGVALDEVAARVSASLSTVRAYLASRAVEPHSRSPWTVLPSLQATVLQMLPQERDYEVRVHIHQNPASNLTIETNLDGPEGISAKLFRNGRGSHIRHAPLQYLQMLEAVDRVAFAWCLEMRSRFQGLGVDIEAVCHAQDRLRESGRKPLDPRPLRQPLLDLLDRCWRMPRERYDGFGQQLSVTIATQPIVNYRNGHGATGERLKGSLCAAVVTGARLIYESDARAVEERTAFSFFVTGSQLEKDKGIA